MRFYTADFLGWGKYWLGVVSTGFFFFVFRAEKGLKRIHIVEANNCTFIDIVT